MAAPAQKLDRLCEIEGADKNRQLAIDINGGLKLSILHLLCNRKFQKSDQNLTLMGKISL